MAASAQRTTAILDGLELVFKKTDSQNTLIVSMRSLRKLDMEHNTVPVPALTAASPQRKEIPETKEKKQQLQQSVIAEKAQLQKSRPKGKGLEEQ